MDDAAPPRSTRRAVDDAALARVRRRMAGHESPWLHREVASRMADRLPIFRQAPATVADWYGWDASSRDVLLKSCPKARLWRVDGGDVATGTADAMRPPRAGQVDAPWWSLRRWRSTEELVTADALPPGGVDLLWAPMGLHWRADPLEEMQRWRSALAVDGYLMFATFGPDTLKGLREVYARRGWRVPHAPFVDMHDLGDMLVQAGFADPVMDQETITLTWSDPDALLTELRSLGGNVDPGRRAGLHTPRWKDALRQSLASLAAPASETGARLALPFEIVYGHAVRPRPRPRVAAETTVGLQDMRSILRGRPRG